MLFRSVLGIDYLVVRIEIEREFHALQGECRQVFLFVGLRPEFLEFVRRDAKKQFHEIVSAADHRRARRIQLLRRDEIRQRGHKRPFPQVFVLHIELLQVIHLE